MLVVVVGDFIQLAAYLLDLEGRIEAKKLLSGDERDTLKLSCSWRKLCR